MKNAQEHAERAAHDLGFPVLPDERPILFSAPMVRALLSGAKTQTRRILNPQPPEWVTSFGFTAFTPPGSISGRGVYGADGPAEKFLPCRHGVPGDRLWVRETWGFDATIRHDFRPMLGRRDLSGRDLLEAVRYSADGPRKDVPRWRPSIYMPRWASRITLDVVSVRVERLQDITSEDARAEGVEAWMESLRGGPDYQPDANLSAYPVTAFSRLWDAINGKRAAWASNPWVWRVEFRRAQ